MELKNFKKILAETPPDVERYVEHSMNLLDRIHELLDSRFGGKQKELAAALGVSEAAVSKLLNGVQNFSIKTIAKLEAAFNSPILAVCSNELNADYVKVKSSSVITTTMSINTNGDLFDQNFTSAHLHSTGTSKLEELI